MIVPERPAPINVDKAPPLGSRRSSPPRMVTMTRAVKMSALPGVFPNTVGETVRGQT